MSKKQQKPPQKVKAKSAPKKESKELTDDQLDRVSGGAGSDFFLKLDGIKGESMSQKLDVSIDALPAVQKTYKW